MLGLLVVALFGVWALLYQKPIDEEGNELHS